MKFLPACLGIVLLVSIARPSIAAESPVNLRDVSLPKIAFDQLEKLRNPENPDHAQLGSPDRCIYLTRPSSKNVIAALFVSPDGGRHWCLNPYSKFVDYGDIPPLTSMTSQQIEQLWDSDRDHSQSKSPNRTYKLSAVNNWENRDVFVDVIISNDHIEKYRIRGWMITRNDSWCTIKRGANVPETV